MERVFNNIRMRWMWKVLEADVTPDLTAAFVATTNFNSVEQKTWTWKGVFTESS